MPGVSKESFMASTWSQSLGPDVSDRPAQTGRRLLRTVQGLGGRLAGSGEGDSARAYGPDLSGYATRPLAFFARYIRCRPFSHAAILIAVLGAVGCSVGTQYGVKFLVDTLSAGRDASGA